MHSHPIIKVAGQQLVRLVLDELKFEVGQEFDMIFWESLKVDLMSEGEI